MQDELDRDEQFERSASDTVSSTKLPGSSTTLKNEVPTRWTSLLLMFQIMLVNVEAVEVVLVKMKKIELILTAAESTLLKNS